MIKLLYEVGMLTGRGLAVWAFIMCCETAHAILRTSFLEPLLGVAKAKDVGFFIGSLIVLGITWLCIQWMRTTSTRQRLLIGMWWMGLTAVFEVVIGLLQGFNWQHIVDDYNPAKGGYMAFGMVILLLAPEAMWQVRGKER
jgi:hypothetical protein